MYGKRFTLTWLSRGQETWPSPRNHLSRNLYDTQLTCDSPCSAPSSFAIPLRLRQRFWQLLLVSVLGAVSFAFG